MFFKKKTKFTEHDISSVIKACLVGDNQAQRCLIDQYLGYAKRVCRRYTSLVHETDEIINESFLKVFMHLDRYDSTQSFKSWLRTILINTTIDYFRKNHKWTSQVSLEDVEIADWHDDVIAAISAQDILAMVEQLPPAYRIVFTLFVVEGFSHREIANLLGIQESTSKSNLRDARRKLQLKIKEQSPLLFEQYSWTNQRLNENRAI